MDNARLKDNYEVDPNVASGENDVSDGEDYHDPGSDDEEPSYKIVQRHRLLTQNPIQYNTPLPSLFSLDSEQSYYPPMSPPPPMPDLLSSILGGQDMLFTPCDQVTIPREEDLVKKKSPEKPKTSKQKEKYLPVPPPEETKLEEVRGIDSRDQSSKNNESHDKKSSEENGSSSSNLLTRTSSNSAKISIMIKPIFSLPRRKKSIFNTEEDEEKLKMDDTVEEPTDKKEEVYDPFRPTESDEEVDDNNDLKTEKVEKEASKNIENEKKVSNKKTEKEEKESNKKTEKEEKQINRQTEKKPLLAKDSTKNLEKENVEESIKKIEKQSPVEESTEKTEKVMELTLEKESAEKQEKETPKTEKDALKKESIELLEVEVPEKEFAKMIVEEESAKKAEEELEREVTEMETQEKESTSAKEEQTAHETKSEENLKELVENKSKDEKDDDASKDSTKSETELEDVNMDENVTKTENEIESRDSTQKTPEHSSVNEVDSLLQNEEVDSKNVTGDSLENIQGDSKVAESSVNDSKTELESLLVDGFEIDDFAEQELEKAEAEANRRAAESAIPDPLRMWRNEIRQSSIKEDSVVTLPTLQLSDEKQSPLKFKKRSRKDKPDDEANGTSKTHYRSHKSVKEHKKHKKKSKKAKKEALEIKSRKAKADDSGDQGSSSDPHSPVKKKRTSLDDAVVPLQERHPSVTDPQKLLEAEYDSSKQKPLKTQTSEDSSSHKARKSDVSETEPLKSNDWHESFDQPTDKFPFEADSHKMPGDSFESVQKADKKYMTEPEPKLLSVIQKPSNPKDRHRHPSETDPQMLLESLYDSSFFASVDVESSSKRSKLHVDEKKHSTSKRREENKSEEKRKRHDHSREEELIRYEEKRREDKRKKPNRSREKEVVVHEEKNRKEGRKGRSQLKEEETIMPEARRKDKRKKHDHSREVAVRYENERKSYDRFKENVVAPQRREASHRRRGHLKEYEAFDDYVLEEEEIFSSVNDDEDTLIPFASHVKKQHRDLSGEKLKTTTDRQRRKRSSSTGKKKKKKRHHSEADSESDKKKRKKKKKQSSVRHSRSRSVERKQKKKKKKRSRSSDSQSPVKKPSKKKSNHSSPKVAKQLTFDHIFADFDDHKKNEKKSDKQKDSKQQYLVDDEEVIYEYESLSDGEIISSGNESEEVTKINSSSENASSSIDQPKKTKSDISKLTFTVANETPVVNEAIVDSNDQQETARQSKAVQDEVQEPPANLSVESDEKAETELAKPSSPVVELDTQEMNISTQISEEESAPVEIEPPASISDHDEVIDMFVDNEFATDECSQEAESSVSEKEPNFYEVFSLANKSQSPARPVPNRFSPNKEMLETSVNETETQIAQDASICTPNIVDAVETDKAPSESSAMSLDEDVVMEESEIIAFEPPAIAADKGKKNVNAGPSDPIPDDFNCLVEYLKSLKNTKTDDPGVADASAITGDHYSSAIHAEDNRYSAGLKAEAENRYSLHYGAADKTVKGSYDSAASLYDDIEAPIKPVEDASDYSTSLYENLLPFEDPVSASSGNVAEPTNFSTQIELPPPPPFPSLEPLFSTSIEPGPSKPAYKENLLPTATVKPVPPVVEEVFSRPVPVPKPPSPSFRQSGYTVKKKPEVAPAIAKPIDSYAEVYSPSYPLSPTEDEKTKTSSLAPLLEAVSQLAKLSKSNQETPVKVDRKQQPTRLEKSSKEKPSAVKPSKYSLSVSTKSSNVESFPALSPKPIRRHKPTSSKATSLEGMSKQERKQVYKEFQKRIVDAAKAAIMPYFKRREVSKEQYKGIMKKAVNKIFKDNKDKREINNASVKKLIGKYVGSCLEINEKNKEQMRMVLDNKVDRHVKKRILNDLDFSTSPPSPQESTFDFKI